MSKRIASFMPTYIDDRIDLLKRELDLKLNESAPLFRTPDEVILGHIRKEANSPRLNK